MSSLYTRNDRDEEEDLENRPLNTLLYIDIKETQWPIIYRSEYNISFMGLEKLHPFDSAKWGRVFEFLREGKMVREDTTVRPLEAQTEDLMVVHPRKYIDSLKAAKLAMERGWAINIGGGFHHCSADRGGGFCAYADITLAIKFLFARNESVKKVMIIDLDAHQGNGHERDFMEDERIYIMDVYNRGIYPHDGFAKRAIKRKVELQFYTEDEEYLRLVKTHVEGALNEFEPDFIMYNAGTDILDGDPLGCLSISPQGIIARDEIVFEKARSRCIPIVMVTSGGYQKTTARIIADSILNLRALQLITCDAAEDACPPGAISRSTSEGGLKLKLVPQPKPGESSSRATEPETSVKRSKTTESITKSQENRSSREGSPQEPH